MSGAGPWSGRCSGRVALPAASPDVESGEGRVRAPESLSSGAVHPGRPERGGTRVSRRRLAVIRGELSARDRAILTSLDRHRFLTTRQLQLLHFHDHATPEAAACICRRVLARLDQLEIIEHLQRRVGGVRAGSASFVWRVGLLGDRLLRQAHGEGARARRKEPSARHLDHCLAIADCHLALVTAARAGHLELLTFATEPDCWRSYLGSGGAREVLKPDLYAVTAIGEYEDHWFVEVDRATESLPTLMRKCVQYERYRRTGREQAEAGVFPLVVWVVPDDTRAAKLQAALQTARGLDMAVFRVTTAEQLLNLVCGGVA
jgi:Replication-relaxation